MSAGTVASEARRGVARVAEEAAEAGAPGLGMGGGGGGVAGGVAVREVADLKRG